MKAGPLDRRITIERFTTEKNEWNEDVEIWAPLVTVWCAKRDASASESYRAQSVSAQITTRFTIRYSSQVADVNPKDRIIYEGRPYNITAVREAKDGRRVALEIDAVARADTEPDQ